MVGADRSVLVRLRADISDFQRKFAAAGGETNAFVRRLEQADGRMANLVQTSLALAPALVPIGALGVPALAGLANQLGATAAAAGVTLLAFQGVGDALKALNDYQIDPTDEHLKKLNQTMEALGPAGQIFVRQLQELRPELQNLQDVAQAGLFPGLDRSLSELTALEPEVEHIIGTISRELGRLAEQGADHLNTDRWREFIGYLDREAAPTLSAMGKTLGYLVEGLASLMMDFDPLADDFTQGMVGYAKAFRDWADGLDQTQGFKDFVDYIRTNGPEAMQTLGALATALLDLITAAAPVGSAVLPVIEALANGLSAIAESPAGPALISVAAAVGTLGRAMALLKAVGLRGDGKSFIGESLNVGSIKQAVPAMAAYDRALVEMAAAETAASQAHARYIGALKASSVAQELIPGAAASKNMTQVTEELVAANQRQASAAKNVELAEKRRSAVMRESLSGLGRATGFVGGLALATSGYSDKVGLANTATYAMMGTIAGPWGAAVGGGIGLAMDFAASNNDVETAIRRADAAANSFDLSTMKASITDLNAAVNQANQDLTLNPSLNPLAMIQDNLSFVHEFFSDTGKEAQEARDKAKGLFDDYVGGINALGQAFGAFKAGHYTEDFERLTPVLERARPAMEALGITQRDLQHAVQDGSIGKLVNQIVDYTHWMDTAAGRTARIADAMAELDDQMVSTEQSAADLKTALDDLLDPQMNLVRATDAWTTGLRHLGDDLDKNNKTLEGNSDAAIKNREAINQRVDLLKQMLGAEADAGAGSKKLANDLKTQKKALIEAAHAAGISRGEMVDYLKTLGLTPKLVQTLIEAQTDKAKAAIAAIKAQLDDIPRSISTTWYVNQVNAANKQPQIMDPTGQHHADGGQVFGPGGPRDDKIPAWLSNREYVMPVAAVDHYGVGFMDAVRARRFADGGSASGARGRSLDSRLEIAQLLQSIQSYHQQLNAIIKKGDHKGEHQLRGIDRQVALLELEAAQRDLRRAKHAEAREAAQKVREIRQGVRSALAGFDLGAGMGPDRNQPLSAQYAAQTRDAFKELRDQVKAAGGELPKHFDVLQRKAVELSRQLGIATQSYEDATAKLDDLKAAAADMSAAVAGIFNNDIFAGGGLANAMSQLGADTNDTAERTRLLQAIAGLGIDTSSDAFKALATQADMQTLRDLNTPEEIAAFIQSFNTRAFAQALAGGYASNAAYGGQIASQTALTDQLHATVRDLTAALEKNQQQTADKIAHATAHATGAAVGRTAYAGTRDGVVAGFNARQKASNSKARVR